MSISIHEAYTGLDNTPITLSDLDNDFNPRGLYRPRQLPPTKYPLPPSFQSTRPIQASTQMPSASQKIATYFNPRGLYRPRQPLIESVLRFAYFNPRGLYRPRRRYCSFSCVTSWNFNPRGLYRPRRLCRIRPIPNGNFNPRGLYRPRPFNIPLLYLPDIFQSTRPIQASTQCHHQTCCCTGFQSTRPIQASTQHPLPHRPR